MRPLTMNHTWPFLHYNLQWPYNSERRQDIVKNDYQWSLMSLKQGQELLTWLALRLVNIKSS